MLALLLFFLMTHFIYINHTGNPSPSLHNCTILMSFLWVWSFAQILCTCTRILPLASCSFGTTMISVSWPQTLTSLELHPLLYHFSQGCKTETQCSTSPLFSCFLWNFNLELQLLPVCSSSVSYQTSFLVNCSFKYERKPLSSASCAKGSDTPKHLVWSQSRRY